MKKIEGLSSPNTFVEICEALHLDLERNESTVNTAILNVCASTRTKTKKQSGSLNASVMSDISNVRVIFFYIQIIRPFSSLQLLIPAIFTEEDDDNEVFSDGEETINENREGTQQVE